MWQPKPSSMSANDVGAVLQQAIGLHQSGRLGEAVRLYDQILQVLLNQLDALNFKGLVYHQKGDFTFAIALIEQAIKNRTAWQYLSKYIVSK